MATSYPVLAARTQRFRLGIPRHVTVSGDGRTVRFVRTATGTSRVGQLWQCDVATGEEFLLIDPAELLGADETISRQEQARRERSREAATGIIGYDVDPGDRRACFALSGELWTIDLVSRSVARLEAAGSAVIDPRLDPTAEQIAYISDGALRVIGVDGSGDRAIAEPDSGDISWGTADFLAAEEMDRFDGFWWAPDGSGLIAQRTDNSGVQQWHISDPANPEKPATMQRYPAAGTANPKVSLWLVSTTGEMTEIVWNHNAYEYLARVRWSPNTDPLMQVLSRDQRRSAIMRIDPQSGQTTVLRELVDDAWVELASAPQWLSDGRLLTIEDIAGWRRVAIDGEPVSPDGLQVRSLIGVQADSAIVSGSTEPTEVHVYRVTFDGSIEAITTAPGVHSAVVGGPDDATVVISSESLESTQTAVTVTGPGDMSCAIRAVAENPGFIPQVELVRLGESELRGAVLFPRNHHPGSAKLPILMHPYGGPHAQLVLASARMFLEPQWLADLGFCVVVVDGRGTPGRGHAWERAILNSFADVTLTDQVAAVAAVAERFSADKYPP